MGELYYKYFWSFCKCIYLSSILLLFVSVHDMKHYINKFNTVCAFWHMMEHCDLNNHVTSSYIQDTMSNWNCSRGVKCPYVFVTALVTRENLVILFENEAVTYSKYWTCVWKTKPKDQKPSSNTANHSVCHMLMPRLKIILNVLFYDQWSSKNTWTLSSFLTLLKFSYVTEVSFVIHSFLTYQYELLFTCKEILFAFHNLLVFYK